LAKKGWARPGVRYRTGHARFESGFEDVGQERRPGSGDRLKGRPSRPESERSHREAGFYRNVVRTRTSAMIRSRAKPAAGSKGQNVTAFRMPRSDRACRSENKRSGRSLRTTLHSLSHRQSPSHPKQPDTKPHHPRHSSSHQNTRAPTAHPTPLQHASQRTFTKAVSTAIPQPSTRSSNRRPRTKHFQNRCYCQRTTPDHPEANLR
jgi:hypothetical protein